MDPATLEAYDRAPDRYGDEWHGQPAPLDLQQLVQRWFGPGRCADVGCGAGRDTAWLASQGYEVVGFDVSRGLLEYARRRYPDLSFVEAGLPHLAGIPDASFDNVVCETVIMHLPIDEVADAVARLVSLLAPSGTLFLSWRVTSEQDQRDGDGRLYSAFEPTLVHDALIGTEILEESESTSASSGRTVHRLIARRHGLAAP